MKFTVEPRGDRAVFIKVDPQHIPLVYNTLSALPRGVHDVVPAFDGVGVHYDPSVLLFAEVREMLHAHLAMSTDAGLKRERRTITIPVRYDGPDLGGVAEYTGLSVDEVIALHHGCTYEVRFMGFAPGFAYLSGLDKRLHTPRRASPRIQVPAGAVGIGGEFTGVYPVTSPGGWQLIGHTTVALFDAARDTPSLLQPGDFVQFIAL